MSTFQRKSPETVDAILIETGAFAGKYLVRWPDGSTRFMKRDAFEAEYTTAEATTFQTSQSNSNGSTVNNNPSWTNGVTKTQKSLQFIAKNGGVTSVAELQSAGTTANADSMLNYLTERGYVRGDGSGRYSLTSRGEKYATTGQNGVS